MTENENPPKEANDATDTNEASAKAERPQPPANVTLEVQDVTIRTTSSTVPTLSTPSTRSPSGE